MLKLFLTLLILSIVGCSNTKTLAYQPTLIVYSDAASSFDRLTMTQRPGWRPESVAVNDKYIVWHLGAAVRKSFMGNESIVEMNERYYYDSPHEIVLSAWRSNYYVVSIHDDSGRVVAHVYRTASLDDAKLYIDAIASIAEHHRAD